MFESLFKNRECPLTDLLYAGFSAILLLLKHFDSDLKSLDISIDLQSGLSHFADIFNVV